jgi:GTP-binding protein
MEARYVKSVYHAVDLPRDRRAEIAVAGKSNVGKSSLLNRLVNRRALAKISRTPGKTHCLNFFLIEPENSPDFYLVDLPGYGYAKVSQTMRDDWRTLIEAYLSEPERPSGLIALFDARREPTDVDPDWLAWLGMWGRPFLVVLTKSDKVSGNARAQAIKRWTLAGSSGAMVPVTASAVTGEGIDKIWQWMDGLRRATRR